MSFDEIEFKYNAKNINLQDFKKIAKKLNPLSQIMQHGTDTFYYRDIQDEFCRHRIGRDINQLTYKRKTCKENSIVREEVNTDLHINTTSETIERFLNNIGYEQKNTINKVSFVYIYENYVLAYYICYTLSMQELGRFFEIEIREDKELGSVKDKLSQLNIIEKLCRPLGISSKDRVSESLFEMYGKNVDSKENN